MTAGKGGKPAVIKSFASQSHYVYTNTIKRNGYTSKYKNGVLHLKI